MNTFPKDEYRTIEAHRIRRAKLSHYILQPETLDRRVRTALSNLQDSLFIWNKAIGKPYFHFSSVIHQDKLNNCRVYNHRSTLLKSLQGAECTMEIGVLHGAFSAEIIRTLQPHHHTMIDLNTDLIDMTLFNELTVKLSVASGRSRFILPFLDDRSFDFIYIDGGHGEEDVKTDLSHAERLLRKDGIIMLNDYCNWSPNQGVPYGVMSAVNDFLNTSDFEMSGVAIDGTGAFDVALRRGA